MTTDDDNDLRQQPTFLPLFPKYLAHLRRVLPFGDPFYKL